MFRRPHANWSKIKISSQASAPRTTLNNLFSVLLINKTHTHTHTASQKNVHQQNRKEAFQTRSHICLSKFNSKENHGFTKHRYCSVQKKFAAVIKRSDVTGRAALTGQRQRRSRMWKTHRDCQRSAPALTGMDFASPIFTIKIKGQVHHQGRSFFTERTGRT